ncbi:hypothetical protein [Butyrivibrio sp. AE3004]|uniref:hypothetical protein n=1 Tax=Butyrivibrio sp. AE3004 TaxID=1506994 RepID=UPI0004946907|nr:hypothetical protein [Butyrivibrio sp. AE3004]
MIKVLDYVKKEKEGSTHVEYEDEYIFSTLKCAAYSHSERALANDSKGNSNDDWIGSKSSQIPTILMDNVKGLIDRNRKSVDAFMYHFSNAEKLNYLIEFKKASKSGVIDILDNGKDDSIYFKFRDTALLMKDEILFGGCLESVDLIKNTHVIVVYAGKNDKAGNEQPRLPGSNKAEKDDKGKQKKAVRNAFHSPNRNINKNRNYDKKSKKYRDLDTESTLDKDLEIENRKDIADKIDSFACKIRDLQFAYCLKDEFSVPGIPKERKDKAKGKIRQVTLFSGTDFKMLLENGDFDNWDWGDYL